MRFLDMGMLLSVGVAAVVVAVVGVNGDNFAVV